MPEFRYQYQPNKPPSKKRFSLLERLKIPRPMMDRGVLLIIGVWFVAIIYVITSGITGYLTTTSNLTYQLNETSAELSKLKISYDELVAQSEKCLSDLESCKDEKTTCQIDLTTCKKYRESLEEQIGNMSALEVENAELRNELDEREKDVENLIKSYVQTVCCLQQKANPDIRYYEIVDGWISCSSEKGVEFSC